MTQQTELDVMTLGAGRELDAIVQERVFGVRQFTQDEMRAEALKVWQDQPAVSEFLMGFTALDAFTFRQRCPRYSVDIAAAWQVVEKMAERGWDSEIRHFGTYTATFYARSLDGAACYDCDSAPRAICLAALDAIQQSTEPAHV